MIEYIVENPLLNPIITSTLWRVVLVFLFGLLLIVALNKGRIKGIWKSHVGERYIGWLLIAPLYLIAVLGNSLVGFLLLLLLEVMIIHEFMAISKLNTYKYPLLMLAVTSSVVAALAPELVFYLPILFLLTLSVVGVSENDAKNSFNNTSTAYFFSVWVIFGLCHLILLNHLDERLSDTHSLLLLLGFAVPLGDICAYTFGNLFRKLRLLDKHKIASNLSPSKTFIGMTGNIIGVGIGTAIMFFALQDLLTILQTLILVFVIGLSGVIGDLIASMLKRTYGVKDSGNKIIGHGGFIDRADSLIISTITLYYLLIFTV